MALTKVYTLAEYTAQDSSKDPALSAALLRRIGQDIGAALLQLPGADQPSAGAAVSSRIGAPRSQA
jgi:hypothetical protein